MTTNSEGHTEGRVKPILFSGPMVRALLDGTKTQTRRANHLERLRRFGPITEFGRSDTTGYDWHFRDKEKRWHDLRHADLLTYLPWQVGDRLWVRESWQGGMSGDGPQLSYAATPDYFAIDAWDGPDEGSGPSFNYEKCAGADFSHWLSDVIANNGPWRPSIHMARWASRLTLTVTDVRVERLQDISEADAIAEGVERLHHGFYPYGIATFMTVFVDGKEVPAQCCTSAHDSYMMLWDSINGRGAHQANSWVAAYTFTVQRGNVDTLATGASDARG